jgi:hypothetical protein
MEIEHEHKHDCLEHWPGMQGTKEDIARLLLYACRGTGHSKRIEMTNTELALDAQRFTQAGLNCANAFSLCLTLASLKRSDDQELEAESSARWLDIEELIDFAAGSLDSISALHYSQAALNAAMALTTMQNIGHEIHH